MLQEIISKLDALMDEPIRSCGDFLKHAFEALEDDCPEEAFRKFQSSSYKAIEGKDSFS